MNRFDLKSFILLIAGRMMKLTEVARVSSRLGYLYTKTPPSPGVAVPKGMGERPARNMAAFGLRSVPVAGTELIVVLPRAGSSNQTVVASDHMGYGPDDLKEGEVALFNSKDTDGEVCRIRLDAQGNVVIIPSASAKVKLGSGEDAQLDQVALFSQLKADYDDLVSFVNNHVHDGVTVGMGTTGRPTGGATALSADVASANVVAKKP